MMPHPPPRRYTLGFMGYGPEESSAVMELTYNYGTTEYTRGNAYSHVVRGGWGCRVREARPTDTY